MNRYNPSDIEPKWRQIWDETGVYTADLMSDKPKYIAMSMFNYPSGAGIHIGHAMNYTISDVMARYKRQQGYESYHPVGWDAFGLPAENFAIKSGVSPQQSMAKIIPSYHTQYKAMGWSNDWSKEISTHLPIYYKWTQWIFSEMFRQGLAYQDARMQWWCTKCQTVLANEQVIDGKCWRHDAADDPEVAKKEVKQWFFKITDYADELLEATDALDWSDVVKTAQKNWIGKSVGAEVEFTVVAGAESGKRKAESTLTVFTTRPDTLFGATFLVVAPEHDMLDALTTAEQSAAVTSYRKASLKKSEIERQIEGKEKTGVFTGSYAVNPVNGERVPIWVADYVLGGYGTGAIMAVPAHDERDHEFAVKFGLPIVRVVHDEAGDDECYHGEGVLVNSGAFDGVSSAEARELIVQHLEREGKGRAKTTYKLRDWSVSRQRYWGAPIPIVNCPEHGAVLVSDDQLPVELPELDDFAPSGDGRSALARATEWLHTTCPVCGGPAERETDTLDTYICSSWYELRYLDPSNTAQAFDPAIANKWMPIDFYNGGDHATAHLLYVRFVARFFHKLGLLADPEPFKKFLFNGKVKASDGSAFSKSKGNGVDPLEIINQGYGADALRTYLMFAAPLDLDSRWDSQGVPATHRFLSRIWNLVQEFLAADPASNVQNPQSTDILRIIHPTIKKVTEDLEDQKYNTAIAAMMKCVNDLYLLKKDGFADHAAWQFALESLVALVAPFAPHIADELWQQLGHESSVQRDSWPTWDDQYLVSDTMTLAVQVNGKVRAEITVATDTSKTDIEAAALAHERTKEYLGTKKPTRVIYVPGRLVNVVI
jgi:leucyl-tRNA synthetase